MLQTNGGGSSDEVIFKMGVTVDPAARGAFDTLKREHEALRQQYAKPIVMAAPITSGGYSIGGPGAGVGSMPVSLTGGRAQWDAMVGVARGANGDVAKMQAGWQEIERQNMSVRERVFNNVMDSAVARNGARVARAEGWRRRQDNANNFWRNDPSMTGMGSYTGGNWHGGNEDDEQRFNKVSAGARQAVEGVSNLVRSFAYLGAASEASLEKAVRGLAKVEAAGAGVRGVMSLASLAGIGGPAGAAVGVGVVAGVAGLSYMGGSFDRRRAAQDAEQQLIDDARLRQSQDEYNAFLRQDDFIGGMAAQNDRRTRNTMYGIGSAGNRGDRAALIETRNRARSWADQSDAFQPGQGGYLAGLDSTGEIAAGEAVRYRKEELAATQEIARIDQARARENIEAAQTVVRELENQLRLEESRVRLATNRQESGAAAYGMMNGRERSRFNSAYEKHANGGVLSENEITILGRGDPAAARDAAIRSAKAGGYDDTRSARDLTGDVARAKQGADDVRARLGEPDGATGAYGALTAAETKFTTMKSQVDAEVDKLMELVFGAIDRATEKAMERKRREDILANSARP